MTNQEMRFWDKVRIGDQCWEWTASKRSTGYGQFGGGGKAHRWVWAVVNGPIPAAMCVLHRCDNPGCVRPSHLFLGTQADNMRDRAAKGRAPSGDAHWSRRMPERVPRGDRHWTNAGVAR